jgi:ABC-type lipoprotein release transport system permease subunit
MLVVFTVLLGSGAIAAVIPAWRATNVNPAKALQAE